MSLFRLFHKRCHPNDSHMNVRLMLQKAELEQRPRSKNPVKAFANYRAARMFLVASKSLYLATKVIKHAIDDTACNVMFPAESI